MLDGISIPMTVSSSIKRAFACVMVAGMLGAIAPAGAVPIKIDDVTLVPDDQIGPATAMAMFKAMGNDEQIDALERAAKTFRTQKSRTATGDWKLTQFYDGLMGDADDPRMQEVLRRWIERYPQSPTPRIIKAHFMLLGLTGAHTIAEVVDRNPQSVTVSPEKLAKLISYLVETRAWASTDPHWYVERARAELLQGTDRQTFQEHILEGVRREPSYVALQNIGTEGVLANRSGNDGQLEDWARRLSQAAGDDPAGQSAYAQAYWHAFEKTYDGPMRWTTQIDWDRFKNSAAALLDQRPTPDNITRMAVFACAAPDRAETARIFALSEKPVGFYPWSSRKRRDACLAWANAPFWQKTYEWFAQWVDADYRRLALWGPFWVEERQANSAPH